jgi:hypothetical protein
VTTPDPTASAAAATTAPAAAQFQPQSPVPADDTAAAGLVDYLLAP